MQRRTRDRGGFPLGELAISTFFLALSVIAFFLLGRLGWSWWVRILVIIGSLYGLFFLLVFLLPRRDGKPGDAGR